MISVGLFGHSGDEEVWNPGIREMLDDMHKWKIDMTDEIYVINVGGYFGESTRSEIEYAQATRKKGQLSGIRQELPVVWLDKNRPDAPGS